MANEEELRDCLLKDNDGLSRLDRAMVCMLVWCVIPLQVTPRANMTYITRVG